MSTQSASHSHAHRQVENLFENLPPSLRAEDNEAGWQLSLEQLARRFEWDWRRASFETAAEPVLGPRKARTRGRPPQSV